MFDAATGRQVSILNRDKVRVNSVAFSPDGRLVAAGLGDWTARVFEARSGREVSRLDHQDAVWTIAFSPDGEFRPNRTWQKQCSPRCRQRAYVRRSPIKTSGYYGA